MPVEVIVNLGFPIAVIALAMLTGTLLERRHFKSIARREKALGRMPVLTILRRNILLQASVPMMGSR